MKSQVNTCRQCQEFLYKLYNRSIGEKFTLARDCGFNQSSQSNPIPPIAISAKPKFIYVSLLVLRLCG
ncbi:hypothetical protein LC605_21030 [Nostoc sp. CHAB 5836]|uniref:hypothetical protein n=1 Tax=Nostoc sp. CHAB 5836 TaxID=2780404 RepID=UPI001E576843|nr:hypothetical protein [Nostoc sp. CHAB 5836]MCC5617523.1 hypothetical protein [Nostoc sp. CHAB 5836]